MNYKEYLQSEHWIVLRKNILSKRKRCQACGIKKKFGVIFNLHHVNYNCLGKETDDDILVLCQPCHLRFHKRKKWKKKYARREPLDFTRKRNPKDKIYNMSDVFRVCERCGKEHAVFYKRYKNNTLHLYMACPNSKPRTVGLKFEPNLPIPTIEKGRTPGI